jgi:hypothetical protein
MFCVRLPSSTKLSDHTASINSCFETISPCRLTSTSSVSSARGCSGTTFPSRRKSICAESEL